MKLRRTRLSLKRNQRVAAAILGTLFALSAPNTLTAQNCGTRTQLTPQQQAEYSNLPPQMLAILRAVQAQRQTHCANPGQDLTDNPDRQASPSGQDFAETGIVDPQSALPPLATPDTPPEQTRPDEVIATLSGDGSNIQEIATANNLTVTSSRRSALLDAFIVRFTIPDGRTVADTLIALRSDDRITTAAPQHLYTLQGETIQDSRFALDKISLDTSNPAFTGRKVKIAVIDTAVDTLHPSLRGAITATFDALPGRPVKERGHGTAIAGLIAGRRIIMGVAPETRLLIARAFDNIGGNKPQATTSSLLSALEWVVGRDAQIINMSFSGPRNAVLSDALTASAKRGILLIATAGNFGPDAPPAHPGAHPSTLAVTATDARDKIYVDANVGSYVFISAPGVDVLAPAPQSGIDLFNGTSFAAPFISGIAALLLEKNPDLNPRDIAIRLERAARDLGAPGRDNVFGTGLANAQKTLQ